MKLTEEEKRKYRYLIALVQRTKTQYVYVDTEAEEINAQERKIFATVKNYRVGVLVRNDQIVQSWRVI